MSTKTISIAKDFHRAPAGRFISDGPYSGEAFKNNFLIPNLNDKNIDKLIIDLNGLMGVGSSFWDEAFSTLITEDHFKYEDLTQKIQFICNDDDTLIPLLNKYLKEAANV